MRVLCQAGDILAKPRSSVRISFASDEGREKAIQEGICAYGDQLRLSPYKGQAQRRERRS